MTKSALFSRLGLLGLSLFLLAPPSLAQSDKVVTASGYVSTDKVRAGDRFKLAVKLNVAEGYHINAHNPTLDYLFATNVVFEAPRGITIGEPKYPAPELRTFEFAPAQPLAVHEGMIYVTAEAEADNSIKSGDVPLAVRVTVQSCNDQLCLAPADLEFEIPIKIVATNVPVKDANSEIFASAAAQPEASDAATALVEYQGSSNSVADRLAASGIASVLVGVFLAGLLLNTTPCVYPIIPITIGFFVNQSASQQGKPRIGRTFTMASMYTLGMALTYSALGVIAAKSGGLFGAALQSPLVLVGLAAVMIALSLSMFGVYEFKLPESVNRMATSSTQSTSGLFGALVMGLTMGIVAAPCIGPFVLGLLVHVGTKGSAFYGFMLFFVLALGLGLPYLVLGTFSGALKSLPRSGLWMVTVRKVFGVVLIGLALYFVMPLMGEVANYVFVGFFAIAAVYLLFWEAGRTKQKHFAWVLRAIGVGAAAIAVWMAIPAKHETQIPWEPYSEQALLEARQSGMGVIIDTFADWCIPCKELDQATFTNADVKREAERFVVLKLDLTRNERGSEAARARDRFGIRGVPTIIFLDGSGKERADLRLEGFEKAAAFLARMKRIETPSGPRAGELAKGVAEETRPVSDASSASGGMASLPEVSLSLVGGGNIDTSSLRGKVALINFWATWCVPCKAEIPWFNEFDREFRSRGLSIVGISLDEEGADKVKPYLKQTPMSYGVVIGDQTTSAAFGIDDSVLPVTLIADKQGRIRFKHIGLSTKEEFQSEIASLLEE